ncbi:hypothetical protein [Streptomyces qinzhouensis]|uniref:DUF4185 domain-containing protein n=1 Tax=Streptomyces qinzhouensis TaxID=2599401 RepID=A0A5B8JQ83_9ACTN|nr:hypothetical protein [Streptomyces qinzhouensis]QDY79883.1 hypothetical protein FQU76_28845 [Streptomyces qinzhouensis]
MKSIKHVSGRRLLVSLLSGLTAVAATLVSPLPAAAAEGTLAPLPSSAVSGFKLSIDPVADYGAYGDAIRGVEKSNTVTRVTPLNVAESAQRTGRPALCHNTGLNGAYKYDGFCWDQADDNTSAYSSGGGWHPQGLTAAHDATGSTYGGKNLYLASWFYGEGSSQNKRGRITIAESTGGKVTYGHVLLVQPTGNANNGNFTSIGNIHADGMVWYGNKLFVANGGELLVFDMQYLWKMSSPTRKEVGIRDGASSADGHTWALPLQGRYRTMDKSLNPRSCPGGTGSPCLGSLSLDRSKTPHALVSGEYRSHAAGAGGRIVRWPLNDATDLPKADNGATIGTTTATAAYATPVWQMQGVATDGTWYYMAGECPTGYDPNPIDTGSYSCIHRAQPGQAPSVLTESPSLTQNLSFSHASGRLWGTNEWTGNRVVFSIDPP